MVETLHIKPMPYFKRTDHSEGSHEVVDSMCKFKITCKNCGTVWRWKATDFENACDLLIDKGWKSDTFLGGMVCQRCKVA